MMNLGDLREYACKISRFVPKVKIGAFEWDSPELIGGFLHCEDYEQKVVVCHTDAYGNRVCELMPQRELDRISQILREAF
jgi:hypothetical protein